jgi:hypothetical protein
MEVRHVDIISSVPGAVEEKMDIDESSSGDLSSAFEAGSIVTTSVKSVFARVAFLGFSEHADEWIDIVSTDRIQVLNSMSGGKRGDAFIRDEVALLHSQFAASELDDQVCTHSVYY